MPRTNYIIGVFDSGVGGLSVAKAIEKELPASTVIFRDDSQHMPYGNKPASEILAFIIPILDDLIEQGCEVIVVACNTVSTTLIQKIRQAYNVPFVAIEPMVKPAAALTKTKTIAVCATPTTLASSRYLELKHEFASGIKVLEPDCSDWSELIENNKINRDHIKAAIEPALKAGADVIVLGCTHYHWIEHQINDLVAGKAQVIQPEAAVVRQLKRVLAQLT